MMNRLLMIALFVLPLAVVALPRQASAEVIVRPEIFVQEHPPADLVEVVGVPPAAGLVWLPGHWLWQGNEWIWSAGRWESPPRATAVWETGRWIERFHAWAWRPGRWVR